MTNLVKRPFGLEWKGGNANLIRYCMDQEALRKVLSEGLYNALSLYSDDTKETAVSVMIEDMMDEFSYEPVEVITETIKDIRKGKRKIYGRVTPFDLREMITDKLYTLAEDRERQHYANKGHSDVEISDRTSGRISDFF